MAKIVWLCAAGLLATLAGPLVRGDAPPAKPAEPSKLAKDLVGTWVRVGTPGKVGDPPAAGGRLKFFTGRHWCVTEADPKTGRVTTHLGGTYALDGDVYSEAVEYNMIVQGSSIGKTHKFKLHADGDTLTQFGIDNTWNEVWKRVK